MKLKEEMKGDNRMKCSMYCKHFKDITMIEFGGEPHMMGECRIYHSPLYSNHRLADVNKCLTGEKEITDNDRMD